jgi:hypothetical protein
MKQFFERKVDPIDEKIKNLKLEISELEDNGEDQAKKLELLNELIKTREAEMELKKHKSDLHIGNLFSQVNPNTIIQGLFGIVSVAMILEYEKTDVISSKSLNIAQKMLGR